MTKVPLQPKIPKMQIPLKYIENSFKYIGSVDDLQTRGRQIGDICTYIGEQYLWIENEWQLIGTTQNCCTSIKTKPKMCTQCGASLHGNICEYCGTEYR